MRGGTELDDRRHAAGAKAVAVAAVPALVSAVLGAIGIRRAYGWDASVTVALFVRGDARRPLSTQYVANNHPYASFLENLIGHAVGTTSEPVMRILPIACAAVACGLLAARVGRRWGALGGLGAGVILATSPLFVANVRDVRGYALAQLCTVASSVLLFEAPAGDRPAGAHRAAYAVAAGVGLGTHPTFAAVLVAHVIVAGAVGRRSRASWATAWAGACAIGALPYLRTASILLANDGARKDPRSPWQLLSLSRELFGRSAVVIVVMVPLVIAGAIAVRRTISLPAAGVAVAAGVALCAVTPNASGLRVCLWLVPLVATLAGIGIAQRRALAALLCVPVAAIAATAGPHLRDDEVANRVAAEAVDVAQRQGVEVCGLGSSTETLAAYAARMPPELFDAAALRRCDVVVVVEPSVEPDLVAAVEPAFPYRAVLPAARPGLLLWRDPSFEGPAAAHGG